MFGFLGGDRGIDSVLPALAALPERDKFHLDIYGDLPASDHWAEHIQAAGLGGHVTLHGFVPDTTLADALDRAHLALNLRQPSRGEASSACSRRGSRFAGNRRPRRLV
jgi:glycosyltransferase involved in cell wall biosynthesis